MVVLKVSFLLSKNLIDPSVVKVSPYYFLYGKYLFFYVVLFYFYIYFATERRFMELKQNNMTSNYFSEEYLMNTVSRFWKKFVAEEISYGNTVAAAPGNVAVAIPASGKRNYKDLVFRKIFHDKEKLLSLYNALNHSQYEDPELLHITTLENAVYLSLQNDLSFVVDFDLWFFEHQSTLNPNMPYRFLLYLASEYSKLNTDDLLYSNKLQMLDTPHFVVFYNGTDPLPEYSTLKLSSAYRNKEEAPQLELQVQVININLGFNAELMDACQILKEYAQFVAEVRKQAKVYPNRQAIVQAVDVCIKKDILKEFLLENKKEVIDMVFFEYDAEAEKRVIYRDGVEEGRAKSIVQLCKTFGMSKEDITYRLRGDTESKSNVKTQAYSNGQVPGYRINRNLSGPSASSSIAHPPGFRPHRRPAHRRGQPTPEPAQESVGRRASPKRRRSLPR